AEDGIRDATVTGVQTCALPIFAAVQGLALGSSRPCLGLSTLLGLAEKMKDRAATLVPMIDAYREQVYAAVYDAGLQNLEEPEAKIGRASCRERVEETGGAA